MSSDAGRESIKARLGWPADPAELRRIRRLWQKHSIAEDRRDVDGLIATLAPDCAYEIVGSGLRWEGRDGARAFYTELFAAFPDNRFVLTDIVIGPQGVFEAVVLEATHVSAFAGLAPTGRRVRLELAILFPWDRAAGLFAGEQIYIDRAALRVPRRRSTRRPSPTDRRAPDPTDPPSREELMRTSFTSLMGIEQPIVQAPIGGLSVPALAGAVSKAGGLGMMAITWLEPDEIRAAIGAVRAITDRPFGINLIIDAPQDERLAVALDEGVQVVSFFWGDPAPYVDRVHAAGAKVTLTVGSAAEAKDAVEAGVDVIVAQGWEAGGHVWGQVSTLALVPAVVDAVGSTPVIAAGGIGDGRGLAAVLALGAGAAWLGTRFVASEEAPAHPVYVGRILAATETDTFYSSLFDIGWPDAPHRTLRNETIDAWLAAGSPPSGSRPGEGDVVARRADGTELIRYSSAAVRAGTTGEIEDLSMWSGQSAGVVREVLPAAEIVRRTVSEAESILRRLARAG